MYTNEEGVNIINKAMDYSNRMNIFGEPMPEIKDLISLTKELLTEKHNKELGKEFKDVQ